MGVVRKLDYKLLGVESENAARFYAVRNDKILDDVVLDLLEKYEVSEADAAVILACTSIKAAKDTAKRMGFGRR